MSAESPRHARSGGPLTVPSQPPSDRSIIDAVSGFINDVTLSSSSNIDPKDVIQWARFETADINEPTPEGDSDNDITPLLLILGYGSGVQVWLIPPNGEAQEVLSWRQGTVRVLRILPTPQHGDCFASKRPLIALCDSASPGPTFCSLSFISIRGGEQVKSIKFKNPILDVLANKRSVVVSFSERFAVFDAATLEDRMCITTCYPCPCPLGGSTPVNPLALGDRWLAYADKKLNQSKRSSGGCEGEGVSSYTATVLHAAKSLSKGLRGLSESVAQSLAGGRSSSQSPSPPNTDIQQPGVVTILDIEGKDDEEGQDTEESFDPKVAHFVAHSEAVIALKFDASGMLLVTADRRGHDFHVFRINPHPCGPSLASVHHLYILHRGDTTAKVQDIAISPDARWTAISTLRGTTHVFAISPYGGPCGVRTHTQPRVVNRLSRFHRSAGLPIHAAQPAPPKRPSGSPVGDGLAQGAWYPNPRLPPYPQPTTASPLAQLRPTANIPTHTITRNSSGRQRLSSLSEDSNSAPLLARARFGPGAPPALAGALARAAPGPAPLAALYLVTAAGTLVHLALHPRPLSGVPKEKICDESPIELQVESVAQWALQRPPAAADLLAPLPPASPLLRPHSGTKCADMCMSEEERWLSQVEIVTHAGPHRRLWMGPQFVFKTYNSTGSNSSLSEAETVEVDPSGARGVARSNPVNMPGVRPVVPVLIDSGSASSVEHSPSDSFRRKSLLADGGRAASLCDVQLREDLAEAMKEDHGSREPQRGEEEGARGGVARAVDPLGCVVDTRARDPPPPLDSDAHTRANSDEATFRPVLRAPAALHPPTTPLLLRPLPRTTTIPVQPLAEPPLRSTRSPPRPLDTRVVIPAALGDAWDPDYDQLLPNPSRADVRPARSRVDDSPTRRSPVEISCKVSESSVAVEPPRAVDPVCVREQDVEIIISAPASAEVPPCTPPARKRDKTSSERTVASAAPSDSVKSIKKPSSSEVISPLAKTEERKEVTRKSSVPIKAPEIIDDIKKVSAPKTVTSTTRRSAKPKVHDEEIKTEDQAWDMLLTEPQKPSSLSVSPQSSVSDKHEDSKPKKKNRKTRKPSEETKSKTDDDSFVEIHAIEEKQQPSSGELVSISSPFEDVDACNLTKIKKSRVSKSLTPERTDADKNIVKIPEDFSQTRNININFGKLESKLAEVEIAPSFASVTLSPEIAKQRDTSNSFNISQLRDIEYEAPVTTFTESSKSRKTKSLSPYLDYRKSVDSYDNEVKDVYVIDSTKEEFPEIQITRGNTKPRKKSPQPVDVKPQEKQPIVDKPIKSWSSIAASKSSKKVEEEVGSIDYNDKKYEKCKLDDKFIAKIEDFRDVTTTSDEKAESSKVVSLQEKLYELCKRTDIMVAECDAPSELNFVEEHHSVLHDLPPLEPLDFGLDDFKMDVMRDSMIDINDTKLTSPICKINIDDILSSIKETSSKAIESSTFNLIDLEKVPAKKEKGFSVIESHKITSQEIKIDDETKSDERDAEIMEKSSDDDNISPVVSTDSDKEDKKTGTSKLILPSSKQSAKSKKSRRKKK